MCDCEACSESTTCELCGLSVMRGSLADHEFVCSRRVQPGLPQSMHSQYVKFLRIFCSLIAKNKLGCCDPYFELLFHFCVGANTWWYGDCMCASWCTESPAPYVIPLLRHQEFFDDHGTEHICEVCGYASKRFNVKNHDCEFYQRAQPWRRDYLITCPSGCGKTLLRSEFPHEDCPHRLKGVPLVSLPDLAAKRDKSAASQL